jgi:hypothetical protein
MKPVLHTLNGAVTRIMPGTQAMEYYEAVKKGDWGSKSKPGPACNFEPHMKQLHQEFLKSMGMTHEQYLEAMKRWNKC